MLCARCGAFFGPSAAAVDVYCRQCDDHFYDRAWALGAYEKALAAEIVNLKSYPVISGRAKELIRSAPFIGDALSVDVILPVPLAPMRRAERGFNQAEIIATALSRVAGVPVDSMSLGRVTHTNIHRGGMDRKARALSVKKAFGVVRPKLVEGKRILLVDDVLTSGSTASSCAEILKKHGAKRVNVFTLARAIRHNV